MAQIKRGLRPAARLSREVPMWTRLPSLWTRPRPRVVFLPNENRTGASRLRVYELARALEPLGWSTLCLPPKLTLAQRQRLIAAARPSVIVLQGSRHALNRPEYYAGHRLVYDIDDADFHLPHLASATEDAVVRVDAITAGSRYIAEWARSRGAVDASLLWTGTPVSAQVPTAHARRGGIVAWAQTRPATYPREAALVREVIRRLSARRPGLTLRLYDRQQGDDPAFAESFATPGLAVEWRKSADYGSYLASMDDVSLGLAPLCPETPFSRGKSFGKVLAYLDRGVPVIGSDAGEHDAFFSPGTGVISNDPAVWVAAAQALLSQPRLRDAVAAKARRKFVRDLSIEAAARRMSDVLKAQIAGTMDHLPLRSSA